MQYQRWLAQEKGIVSHDYSEREPTLGCRSMPGAQWFPNARLNFAEHVFRNRTADHLAVNARSWRVGPGDRVASFMPNRPETVVAFLACASIGAIWSSCPASSVSCRWPGRWCASDRSIGATTPPGRRSLPAMPHRTMNGCLSAIRCGTSTRRAPPAGSYGIFWSAPWSPVPRSCFTTGTPSGPTGCALAFHG